MGLKCDWAGHILRQEDIKKVKKKVKKKKMAFHYMRQDSHDLGKFISGILSLIEEGVDHGINGMQSLK